MIEFEALAMKVNTNELHVIFLLKKNVQLDIIKTILGYSPITVPETLKEWKVAITSVKQCQDHWQWTLFLFFLFTLFFFFFFFFLYFLFLEQLRLGFISHAVTLVTSWWQSHKTNHETWKNRVEGFGIKWHHTIWTTHVGLMSYTWSLG